MENLIGKEVTVFGFTWMATTKASRGVVTQQEDNLLVVKLLRPPRTRKDRYQEFELKGETLVFLGLDVPFKADSEGGCTMHGNACYNFIGELEDIKLYVETLNLNEKFYRRDSVMKVEMHGYNSTFTPVFPEADTDSAVVDQYRSDSEKAAA